MWSGSAEYKSNETLPVLKAHLEKQLGATCTIHEVPKANDALPGIDDLEACDVAVIFVKRVKLPPDQLAKVKRYVDAGRPVVGLRTASHAFQTWLAFDPAVLGGDYKGHEKRDLPAAVTRRRPAHKAAGHPVLAGVPAFATPGKLYHNPKLATDATVLLTADNGQTKQPVAWVRDHNGGRVFYTSLGVPDDFKDPAFVKLLTNAVRVGGQARAGKTVEAKAVAEPPYGDIAVRPSRRSERDVVVLELVPVLPVGPVEGPRPLVRLVVLLLLLLPLTAGRLPPRRLGRPLAGLQPVLPLLALEVVLVVAVELVQLLVLRLVRVVLVVVVGGRRGQGRVLGPLGVGRVVVLVILLVVARRSSSSPMPSRSGSSSSSS
jgi:type 1 glutamine amidotransferase